MERTGIDWRKVSYFVLLSRQLDRLEEQKLTPQGKVKYQFSAGGHELAQVLLAQALDHPHDAVMAYYRSRPLALACGLTPVEALSGGMARTGGPSEGRDVGVMFNLPRRQGPTILPASGDVGAQYSPVAGWAQAITYRQRVLGETDWSGAIGVATGGEGSVSANGFWAALNIATTLRLPMLFFIEDNSYGLSVPVSLQTPGGDISANLGSFKDLKMLGSDGTEPKAAWEAIQAAVEHVRSGAGPCLLHMHVVRLSGHTFIDDQSYKSEATLASEAERDPLKRLHEFMLSKGMTPKEWGKLTSDVQDEVDQALIKAEDALQPDPAQARRHVFFEGEAPKQGGLRPERALISMENFSPKPSGPRINLVDAVRRTLETEMKLNARMLVFGEDVGVKGGVHGATLDMQTHFGSERVFDTSLSEDASSDVRRAWLWLGCCRCQKSSSASTPTPLTSKLMTSGQSAGAQPITLPRRW
jgi:2-oxoisovalerate dehydrogenase E1 component